MRQELFEAGQKRRLRKYGFSGERPVLLCFGGGSGSAAINAALDKALPDLLKKWDVLHIRGKGVFDKKQGYVPLEYDRTWLPPMPVRTLSCPVRAQTRC